MTPEQRQFVASLHDLLTGADVAGASRSWADGDHGPGRKLWSTLADIGVTTLAVPETGAHPADVVAVCEELGHHAVPGPVAETVAAVPTLLGADPGGLLATLAAPPRVPYAADADAADVVLLAASGAVHRATPGAARPTVDAARRLFALQAVGAPISAGPVDAAFDAGALATAAQLLGAGRALLERTVAYARQRTQFGRPIGAFQAVQHALADVAVGLEFARPLLYAAAVDRSLVSAAKVASADAAHRAARTALQVHGAIGYTEEYGLDRWLTQIRALIPAWGSPALHRGRIMAELTRG